MKKLVLLLVLGLAVSAQAGLVPNGGFETILKPGEPSVTGVLAPAGGAWSMGVGPDCPIDNGEYDFSDGTSGTAADIPGWVGYQPDVWVQYGGTYDRPTESGNNQGSVANEHFYTGLNCYLANGAGWGNPAGGLIVSDAPLPDPGTCNDNVPYLLSMYVKGNAGPIALVLLANGKPVVPNESVTPVLTDEWQQMTRTYNTLPGGDLTVVVGIDRPLSTIPPGAYGGQSQLDDVTFGCIPEPATMTLLGLGGLASRRRK